MALKAGVFGLNAGSRRPIGGSGGTFAVRSAPFSGFCGVLLLRSPGQPGHCSDINQRLIQNWHGQGESDCLIKTKHCDGQRVMLTQCDFCPVL